MTLAQLLSLRGRTALVLGGSGGIGAAVVSRLGEAGARVVSVDRPGAKGPAAATCLECDISQSAAVSALFDRLRAESLEPDLVVHSVGIVRDRVLWKLGDEEWREVLAVNLDSAFWVLRRALPVLRQRGGGSIVLISSINGERGKVGQANYAASKAGMIGLARTAAREAGRFGVRVNVIAPGLVRTAMTAQLPPEVVEAALAESALGAVCEPLDVANAALFLCSPLSARVTGQVLRVDCGQLIA